jgi:hypothetical protein
MYIDAETFGLQYTDSIPLRSWFLIDVLALLRGGLISYTGSIFSTKVAISSGIPPSSGAVINAAMRDYLTWV